MQDHVGTTGPGQGNSTLLNANEPWQLRFWCKPSTEAELAEPAAVTSVGVVAEDLPRHHGK
jgi:hypothetical protein